MNTTFASLFGPALWAGFTFVAGIASKGMIDSFLRRRDDSHKLLLDKRIQFLQEQLSKFYWPIYVRLQKDNLIWERMKERNQDAESAQARLGLQIESGVILPNHKEALEVIEAFLHLAGDKTVVEASLRYIRHVRFTKC